MITDFLNTSISKDELSVALKVLLEFKKCESMDEFMGIWGSAWAKLEQLEEFLEFLVNGKPLADDTVNYMQRNNPDTLQ